MHYAVVAYIKNPLGHFVEDLRRELYPEHAHLPAHVTVLPPRRLHGTEAEAVQSLQQHSARFSSFEVRMGEVESFCPTTPTVFLRVASSAHRFRDLHDDLNTGPLRCEEQWPYMPHLTIVKMPELTQADHALIKSRESWSHFSGSRSARIEELTFVREGADNHWIDLATIRLGEPAKNAPAAKPSLSR
jgi:2'-5' RNA ligase